MCRIFLRANSRHADARCCRQWQLSLPVIWRRVDSPVKRRRALLGSNPPSNSRPKGASMHVVCISVPGEDHPPRGLLSVFGMSCRCESCRKRERFSASAIVPLNNRPTSSTASMYPSHGSENPGVWGSAKVAQCRRLVLVACPRGEACAAVVGIPIFRLPKWPGAIRDFYDRSRYNALHVVFDDAVVFLRGHNPLFVPESHRVGGGRIRIPS